MWVQKKGWKAVEVLFRYDWISHYMDEKWNKYSLKGNPIAKDVLCRFWKIYKVKWNEQKEDFDILSEREDE